MQVPLYKEYFEIDRAFFSQINPSTVRGGWEWKKTYPHRTFVQLLKNITEMLGRRVNKSIWIEGAYGTGKSQCAYALKAILEAPEAELRKYWQAYEALRKEPDLLDKLLGYKSRNILVVHRYASGGILSVPRFILAVQESVQGALKAQKLDLGEATLRQSIVRWLSDTPQQIFFDALLKKPKWSSRFAQDCAQEVIEDLTKLKDDKQIQTLIGNIFDLAEEEGVTALRLDMDGLIDWLRNVIAINGLGALVFIWDEFSDYCRNNGNTLSEFQKLAEFVGEAPFYLIPVTHEAGSMYHEGDSTWKKIIDRFVRCEINLPDSIAFELTQHAMNVSDSMKGEWKLITEELNDNLKDARKAVKQASNIPDDLIKGILPLHPMAALLLNSLSSAFASNQRSMFDFIKNPNTDDLKSFQWFIANHSPISETPLLTIDLLWSFFYEKGKENLTTGIRAVLDTYSRQQNLDSEAQKVLKAILIMQAIDMQRGGAVDLFKPTDYNLSLAFEGIPALEGSAAVGAAKKLVRDGVLWEKPIGGGRYVFNTIESGGDQSQLDTYKKELSANIRTAQLASEGQLQEALPLTTALKQRYEFQAVTLTDFSRTINILRDELERAPQCQFYGVLAFAKDDEEQKQLRKKIQDAADDASYQRIVFVDMTTPLGRDALEQYLDYAATEKYQAGKDNALAKDYHRRYLEVLSQWRKRIEGAAVYVYTYGARRRQGQFNANAREAQHVLEDIIFERFEHAFDFRKGLTDAQLGSGGSIKNSAKFGAAMEVGPGPMKGIEKNTLQEVWGDPHCREYWLQQPTLPISKIKQALDAEIARAFDRDGRISIRDIYQVLSGEFGFLQTNLYAFLTGFLLKEYVADYRYCDANNNSEPMGTEKLGEMLAELFKQDKRYKETFIQKLQPEEIEFLRLIEAVLDISQNRCPSAAEAVRLLPTAIGKLGLPLWCLSEITEDAELQQSVDLLAGVAQKQGKEAIQAALALGSMVLKTPGLTHKLQRLITAENCKEGMLRFLDRFEGGAFPALAKEIGAEPPALIQDVRGQFGAKYASLWVRSTGEDELRKLITQYRIIHQSRQLLGTNARTLKDAMLAWKSLLRTIRISNEALPGVLPEIQPLLPYLNDFARGSDLRPENYDKFLAMTQQSAMAVCSLQQDLQALFNKVYKVYLEDLSDEDKARVAAKLPVERMFHASATECNRLVTDAVEAYQKTQLKTQLAEAWRAKTRTKSPREWSGRYRMPILIMIPDEQVEKAKRAFSALNSVNPSESDIKNALAFLEQASFFDDLNDPDKREAAFRGRLLGKHAQMLPPVEDVQESLLERIPAVEPYEWDRSPAINEAIQIMAKKEYDAGGSDRVARKIDTLSDAQAKVYLRQLIKSNMAVGLEILAEEGG